MKSQSVYQLLGQINCDLNVLFNLFKLIYLLIWNTKWIAAFYGHEPRIETSSKQLRLLSRNKFMIRRE